MGSSPGRFPSTRAPAHPSPCPPAPLRLSCTAARFASWSPRSGDAIGRGQPHCCSPSSPRNVRHQVRAAEGAEPVGAVIRRPARHRLALLPTGGRHVLGSRPRGPRPPKPRHRPSRAVLLRRAGAEPRAIPEPIRAAAQPAFDFTRGGVPPNAPRPRRRFVHRASPSRNGRPAHRHQRRGWNACCYSLSPDGRALSRKPIPPPHTARLSHGRGPNPGGAPEFRTE